MTAPVITVLATLFASSGSYAQTYSVTDPNQIFVNVALRRAALAGYGALGRSWTQVNPYAGLQNSVPTVSFSGAAVTLNESVFQNGQGQTQVNDMATVAFTNLATSDGYSAAKFGVFFGQVYGTTSFFVQFRPSIDPNLANIPGLVADLQFSADPAGQTISFPPFGQLSELDPKLQQTLVAIVAQLPAILQNNTQLTIGSAGGGRTLWSLATAIAYAQQFKTAIFSAPSPSYRPVPTYTCDLTGALYTNCVEDPQVTAFATFLTQYGADYLGSGDPGVAATLLKNLRTWAAGGSLLTYPGYSPNNPNISDVRIKYNLDDFISLPLLNTWVMLRQDPQVRTSDRTLIDGWISQLLGFTTIPYGGPQNSYPPNNHGDLHASVLAALGIALDDSGKFASGIQRYAYSLSQQINPDGGFPLEVSRGACALRYQNTRIGNLVAIAELAAGQGYDLYSMSFNGVSLHTAIKFLLDSTANPALVAGYAAQNGACNAPTGVPMEVSTYTLTYGNFTRASWIESYIARFPDTTLGQRLQYLVTGGLPAVRPVYSFDSGGMTTAFSAVPPPVSSNVKLVAAVLPSSRSVQLGATATAFATIINGGSAVGTGCGFVPKTDISSYFAYQTTDPATNALTGALSAPVDIPAGAAQSFVFALTPYAAIGPSTTAIDFACTNADAAPTVNGLNTLLYSASATPVPDVVALAATSLNDGILHLPSASGSNAFAVATVNVGAGAAVTAKANTGTVSLPLAITLCQTDPTSGQCLAPPAANVSTTINANATPTFAIFAAAQGTVPFLPASNRIFIEFRDTSGTVRGSTSVAVTTQ